MPARMRIAMTGTPIENDLTNLWSLFDFLNKGLLGTSQDVPRLLLRPQRQSGGLRPAEGDGVSLPAAPDENG